MKELESERLILRAFKEDDAECMFKNWASDERVTKYLRWNPYKDVEQVRKTCKKWESNSRNEDDYHFAIVLKEINEPIGTISIVDLNKEKKCAELGYCLGYDFWNKGLATEALKLFINYISKLNLVRIYAECDIENINSMKVLEKCGFEKEGILRKYDFNNQGELIDIVLYSIIETR